MDVRLNLELRLFQSILRVYLNLIFRCVVDGFNLRIQLTLDYFLYSSTRQTFRPS